MHKRRSDLVGIYDQPASIRANFFEGWGATGRQFSGMDANVYTI